MLLEISMHSPRTNNNSQYEEEEKEQEKLQCEKKQNIEKGKEAMQSLLEKYLKNTGPDLESNETLNKFASIQTDQTAKQRCRVVCVTSIYTHQNKFQTSVLTMGPSNVIISNDFFIEKPTNAAIPELSGASKWRAITNALTPITQTRFNHALPMADYLDVYTSLLGSFISTQPKTDVNSSLSVSESESIIYFVIYLKFAKLVYK